MLKDSDGGPLAYEVDTERAREVLLYCKGGSVSL